MPTGSWPRAGRHALQVLAGAAVLTLGLSTAPWPGRLPTATARPPLLSVAQPSPGYLDDRSTAEAVVNSLYNAVNLRQYVRAYSYWEPGAVGREVPAFEEFQQGYAKTRSVQVTMGTVTSGVGAGQLYWSVPVTLVSTANDGGTQTFVGCYRLHLSRPELQAAPPFHPRGIQSASIEAVADDADTASLMASACQP